MESVFHIQLFNILWNVLFIFQGIKSLMYRGYIFAAIACILVNFGSEGLKLFFAFNGHFEVSLFGFYFFDMVVLVF